MLATPPPLLSIPSNSTAFFTPRYVLLLRPFISTAAYSPPPFRAACLPCHIHSMHLAGWTLGVLQLIDLAGAEANVADGVRPREPPWERWAASGRKPLRMAHAAARFASASAGCRPAPRCDVARGRVVSSPCRSHSPRARSAAREREADAIATLQRICRGHLQRRRCIHEIQARHQRRLEGVHIHQSLQALTELLHMMREDPASIKHETGQVELFERSVLTRLLRSALTGDAAVCIFLCINPHSSCVETAMSTLAFGSVIKDVRTKAKRRQIPVSPTRMRIAQHSTACRS